MASLLEKVMVSLVPIFLALESHGDITFESRHPPSIFPLGGTETSSAGETTRNGVNHKSYIFLFHFSKKGSENGGDNKRCGSS